MRLLHMTAIALALALLAPLGVLFAIIRFDPKVRSRWVGAGLIPCLCAGLVAEANNRQRRFVAMRPPRWDRFGSTAAGHGPLPDVRFPARQAEKQTGRFRPGIAGDPCHPVTVQHPLREGEASITMRLANHRFPR